MLVDVCVGVADVVLANSRPVVVSSGALFDVVVSWWRDCQCTSSQSVDVGIKGSSVGALTMKGALAVHERPRKS